MLLLRTFLAVGRVFPPRVLLVDVATDIVHYHVNATLSYRLLVLELLLLALTHVLSLILGLIEVLTFLLFVDLFLDDVLREYLVVELKRFLINELIV